MARILIVDDSEFLTGSVRTFLEEEGHDVVATAGNGFEGVAQYKAHDPDLTLLDITMPGMGGRHCLAEILAHDRNAAVLMVSAVASRPAIVDCLTVGARGYITKPLLFHDEDFCAEFRTAIEVALSDG